VFLTSVTFLTISAGACFGAVGVASRLMSRDVPLISSEEFAGMTEEAMIVLGLLEGFGMRLQALHKPACARV